jgi:shikimate kinase
MKVFLIGMPGSGKSTLGKLVAEALQMTFVDLDQEIEKHEGKSIPKIFMDDGEDHFRKIESTLLSRWAGNDRNFIMATGGGAPCMHKGIEVINRSGLSIFLDVPVNELLKRLQSKNDRPLLSTDVREKEKILFSLREARISCYKQAKISLSNPNVDTLLEAIHFKK